MWKSGVFGLGWLGMAVGFTALGVMSASCLNTSGLAGGAEPTTDAAPMEDTTPVNPNPCGKDLQNDLANCGTCGNVCPFGANSFPLCVAGACKIGCNTQYGNCDKDDKNGCEDVLAGDPLNCNACGRDCGGGACIAGQCGPVNLAPTTDAGLADGYPLAFTMDATSVFYSWYSTTFGTCDIVKLDKATRVTTILAAPSNLYTSFMATDDDPNGSVYFTRSLTQYFPAGGPYTSADGAILKVSKTSPDGGIQTPVVVTGSSGPGVAGGPFVDGNTHVSVTTNGVYFSTYGMPTTGAGVFKCPLTGSCAVPTQLTPNQYGTYSLAVDGKAFIFNNVQDQTVVTCPLVGCPVTPTPPLASSISARILLLDATNYYWINQSNASVLKIDRATKTQTVLASGQPSPYSIAVDDKNVYWVGTDNPATINSCAITGCGGIAVPVVPNLTAVRDLGVDPKAIYWMTQNAGGSIFKVVK